MTSTSITLRCPPSHILHQRFYHLFGLLLLQVYAPHFCAKHGARQRRDELVRPRRRRCGCAGCGDCHDEGPACARQDGESRQAHAARQQAGRDEATQAGGQRRAVAAAAAGRQASR